MSSPSPESLRSSSRREHRVSWSSAGLPKRGHMPHLLRGRRYGALSTRSLSTRPPSSVVIRALRTTDVACGLGVRTHRCTAVDERLVAHFSTCYSWSARPRSSVDRALASEARGVGSNPAGGSLFPPRAIPTQAAHGSGEQYVPSRLPIIPPVRPVRKAR